MIWSHFFFRFQWKPRQRRGVAGPLLEGNSALFLRVLSLAWNVKGQCGPGVSKGLDSLAIPSVSVRPGGCLFLLFLMHVGLSAGIA